MRIEISYPARITGFTNARARTESTKIVRRTGKFSIEEYRDEEAPVAYRRYADHGTRSDPVSETRWLNGRHWRIADAPEGVLDPKEVTLSYTDRFCLYGPVFQKRRWDMDWAVDPSVVEGWHRLTEDTTDADRSKFKRYVERNAVLIGGRFAFCVDEPQVGMFVNPGNQNEVRDMRFEFSSGVTTTGLSKAFYQMSLKEFPEALEEIRRISPVEIARYRGTFERSDIIIPDAFTDSMVESAAARTVDLMLTIGEGNRQDFDLPSRVAFQVACDKIKKDGRLISDAIDVPDIVAELGDLLRTPANRRSRKPGIFQMRHCIDVLLPIATRRLAESRQQKISPSYEQMAVHLPLRR